METTLNIPSPPIYIQAIGEAGLIRDIQSVLAGNSLSFQLTFQPALEPLQARFRRLALQWKRETAHLSLVKRKIKHPAYREIIDMRYVAVPLILKELSERPNHWMPALKAITGLDPAPKDATVEEAIHAWLAWGREQKYLT